MKYIPLILAAMLLAPQVKAQEPMPKMMYKTTEIPSYRVEQRLGDAEIRQYAPRITAEVTVSGNRSDAISAGFRVLAGYIFGGNAGQDKVAMTAPVAQKTAQDGAWVVQFTMPSDYTMDSLPVPQDKSIRLVAQVADRQVVLQFSGRAGESLLASKDAELRAIAAANGLDLGAGPIYAFYDDPFTLPWNRRNEVAFVLR
jgi:hypothetical protein